MKKNSANMGDGKLVDRKSTASCPSQRYTYVKKVDLGKKYPDSSDKEDQKDGSVSLLQSSEMEPRFPRMMGTSDTGGPLFYFQKDLKVADNDFDEELRTAAVPGEEGEQEPDFDASYFSRGDTPSPAPSVSVPSSSFVFSGFSKWADGIEREDEQIRGGRRAVCRNRSSRSKFTHGAYAQTISQDGRADSALLRTSGS
ncbi:unnamed protein product [Hydatigera taeniaeformis]|uniref:AGC-kinase C-terminal domain-containing protein n=1 Tax=Hydatigena taeniaeformis TaxID=6205 RepID=A0A0R3WYT0_HYDTA|nr:unnamed protein product [Hydatigera taeniaeformis]